MFELREFSAFKQHARDFLVQTKSFADKDNAELFAEEATAMHEVPSPCPALEDCMIKNSLRSSGQAVMYILRCPHESMLE